MKKREEDRIIIEHGSEKEEFNDIFQALKWIEWFNQNRKFKRGRITAKITLELEGDITK